MRRKPSLCQNLATEERCICAQQHARASLKEILPSMAINGKLFELRHNIDPLFLQSIFDQQLKYDAYLTNNTKGDSLSCCVQKKMTSS
jgi:isocitrate dehydrogenase